MVEGQVNNFIFPLVSAKFLGHMMELCGESKIVSIIISSFVFRQCSGRPGIIPGSIWNKIEVIWDSFGSNLTAQKAEVWRYTSPHS